MKKLCFSIFLSFSAALLFGETLIVSSVADDNSAGTLRYVLANAKDGDVVVFDDSLKGETIKIVKRSHADTAIRINASVSIIGPEDKSITLDGGYSNDKDTGSRIFALTNSVATLTCKNLVFEKANGRDWGSEIAYGGAIYADGNVVLENCSFFENRVGIEKIKGGKSVRGGAAAHVLGNLTVNNCEFIENKAPAGNLHGGVFVVFGDKCSIKNSKFNGNTSGSYNAGICVPTSLRELEITNCSFIDNRAGGSQCVGGVIFVLEGANVNIFVKDTIFRGNGFTGSGANGGVLYARGGGTNKIKFINCEFSGNRGSGTSGGVMRVESGSEVVLVNCTVADNSAASHGAGLDLRGVSYLVNCTITGNILTHTSDRSTSGGIYHGSAALSVLNTVVVHNYYMLNSNYEAGSGNVYNKINSTTLKNMASLADGSVEDDEEDLFASYRKVSSVTEYWSDSSPVRTFAEPVHVPALNADEKRSRVVEIAKNGPLDGKGLLVKMTDDASYIAYSADKGATWITFYGEEDSSAKLLLSDQRGVAFSEKRIPIGAAAIEFPMATQILVY